MVLYLLKGQLSQIIADGLLNKSDGLLNKIGLNSCGPPLGTRLLGLCGGPPGVNDG